MPSDERTPASTDEAGGGRRDFGVGVASVTLGIVLLAATIPGTIGPLGSEKTILAMLGASGLILFGAILAASNLSAMRPPSDRTVEIDTDDAQDDETGSRITAIGTLGIVLVYAFALEWLGYILASYLCVAALMLLLGVRSIAQLAVLPALIVGAVYLGIDVALGSNLPEGEIDWRLVFTVPDTTGDR